MLKEIMKLPNTLNEEERGSATQLCLEFDDIFMLRGDKLTFTIVKTFTILLLPETTLTNKPQYQIPHAHHDEYSLEEGII